MDPLRKHSSPPSSQPTEPYFSMPSTVPTYAYMQWSLNVILFNPWRKILHRIISTFCLYFRSSYANAYIWLNMFKKGCVCVCVYTYVYMCTNTHRCMCIQHERVCARRMNVMFKGAFRGDFSCPERCSSKKKIYSYFIRLVDNEHRKLFYSIQFESDKYKFILLIYIYTDTRRCTLFLHSHYICNYHVTWYVYDVIRSALGTTK